MKQECARPLGPRAIVVKRKGVVPTRPVSGAQAFKTKTIATYLSAIAKHKFTEVTRSGIIVSGGLNGVRAGSHHSLGGFADPAS